MVCPPGRTRKIGCLFPLVITRVSPGTRASVPFSADSTRTSVRFSAPVPSPPARTLTPPPFSPSCFADYKKYAKAHTYITTNPGCEFILTNADPTYPAGGAFYPGSGSMSAPLRYSTKKTPTIIGKPHRHMMETIMAAWVVPFSAFW